MPTLSELAGFGAGTSPLGLLSGAVDERTRYYANIVRGLLDNPAALVEQLRAQNAENVWGRARVAQDTQSVMPGIAEPAQRAAFDEAMNIGLLGATQIVKGHVPLQGVLKLDGAPNGYQMYPSGTAAIKFTEHGTITVQKLADGRYTANISQGVANASNKPSYVVGDSINEVETAAINLANKRAASTAKDEARTLRGMLEKEFGESFVYGGSTQSKSKYITYKPTGDKIRISDHSLPLHYESSDLDLPANLTDKELFARIAQFLRGG